ncbi:carbon storage regulator, CsrA [Gracilibacillus orientalis]|uniref:Translational regulator CsrA n=1 Tax=Gracilibacillus orientalis TaxID=334253 RepID=A0A1I4P7U2_9BACI|nr:carbon storage regulator CsrA [Gracilibacillus orientalis]SFM23695.1 carbon storage regulator, CsrA [Gracilibacillus orientalis]
MLVLTRKVNEAIRIGDDIEVKIVAIEGDQIKLGISAPKHVDIHRQEIYQSIQDENSEAADVSTKLLDLIKKNDKKD